jgi:hypothetical protein
MHRPGILFDDAPVASIALRAGRRYEEIDDEEVNLERNGA